MYVSLLGKPPSLPSVFTSLIPPFSQAYFDAAAASAADGGGAWVSNVAAPLLVLSGRAGKGGREGGGDRRETCFVGE